jgi:prepilin-type N-terminal cleavage/methylation domain-containing protein
MSADQPSEYRFLADAKAAESGFTLLEVIVALAIAAIALIGLFKAGSGGLVEADTAVRIEEAVERAQSHLAAFGLSDTIRAGRMAGDDGDGYSWEVRAQPIGVAAQPDLGAPTNTAQEVGPPLALYDIAVTISWRSGRRERSVLLETRRLGVAPAGR